MRCRRSKGPAGCSTKVRIEACLRILFLGGAAGVAAVPSGYARVGHRTTGYTLAELDGAGGGARHETVMFTAEGGVFTKP